MQVLPPLCGLVVLGLVALTKWIDSEYAFLRRRRVVAQLPPESSHGCKCRGAKPMIVYGACDRWRPLEAAPRGVNNAPLDLV
jgi:hypothetical protein